MMRLPPLAQLTVKPDWWVSGWSRILPRQATVLFALVGAAGDRWVAGDVEHLAGLAGRQEFDDMTGGLLAAPDWDGSRVASDAITIESFVSGEREFRSAIQRAHLQLPTSVIELAGLMCYLGIIESEMAGTTTVMWGPDILPLASDVLPVSAAFVASEDALRWRAFVADPSDRLRTFLAHRRPERRPRLATIVGLAGAIDVDVWMARLALQSLEEQRAVVLLDPRDRSVVDPEVVSEDTPVYVMTPQP